MTDKNNLQIQLTTILDSAKVIAHINKLKKKLKKENVNLQTILDTSSIKQSIKQLVLQNKSPEQPNLNAFNSELKNFDKSTNNSGIGEHTIFQW